MVTKTDRNTIRIQELESDFEKLQKQVERIVDILKKLIKEEQRGKTE